MKYLLLVFMLTIIAPKTFAANADLASCKFNKLGWHFYCERKKKKSKENHIDTLTNLDPLAELKTIKQELEEKKALAVLHPTQKNIKNYIILQRKQLERASLFSDQWRRVVWKNPELDYTLVRPVNNLGKQAWLDERNKDEESAIDDIRKRYGIFFIYRSDCLYCHRFSPILKNFTEKYGFTVQAISQDGGTLAEWPDSMVNNGQIEKLGLNKYPVPATILYDNKEHSLIPIGFGLLSSQELSERIFVLLKKKVGNDY